MEKVKIKGFLISTIRENKKLENKKKVILKKHSGYWEFPSYVKRELREIEARIEENNIEHRKTIKKIY